ncbi:diphthine--ammonia ligase [Caldibacillus thermolactis]|jgi:uncharacterized protein (TIGR00290 family)|uniref:Diphthine--ammonia ligase n=1 Tax=Pallidibacillus thermolactis TaxID=251051 RepID=A0ABT2WER7_9BACI|nr:diphthine--ammonia ligase [Pallidibacillus thermolactis]MCU9594186.1 diphthine--ammonia ligase [Pallidibacillus thermolactis]MCU9601152.1 diphthine--ammonia ligase [Pallidibacillus thermolactis subsp. kokeshiiformis]
MKKALLSWSGGKDAAIALTEIYKNKDYEIVALLTTLTEDDKRVSMHGVRKALLDEQAKMLELPIEYVYIPPHANNQLYEQRMKKLLSKYLNYNVDTVIFGDLFIEEIRHYRENQLSNIGMKAVFPLWQKKPEDLINKFLYEKYQAVTVCIDQNVLPVSFLGKPLNEKFFSKLPETVNICGEHGEYHTFVYDCPLFKQAIPLKKGNITTKWNRFALCDFQIDKKSS